MKTFKFLFLALITVSLYSCGNDDDATDDNDLAETWNLVAFTYEGTSVSTTGSDTIESSFNGVGENINSTFTFEENPNTFSAQGSYDIVLTTTINGEATTETYTSSESGLAFDEDGTWTLNGSTLTIAANNGEIANFEVTTLTDDVLVLQASQETSFEQGETSQTSVINVTYTFNDL
ncbi:hypothetical protein SCB49_08273 [unidentified eubacterium SCB49]|nr:hypothetical protein SCB49_08273 [unidentified eubacterium SCB49]